MADELVTALLRKGSLRVLVATASDVARHARELSHLRPASASLLAQGLAASALLGALQKNEDSRLNLQPESDELLRGMFLDADARGNVREYVKNRDLDIEGHSEPFRWRPALGNQGFLSVLRDRGNGEHFRSAVELQHFELAKDLEAYFASSDQIRTHVAIELCAEGAEPLAAVAGVLVQPLPDGDLAAFTAAGERLRPPGGLRAALARDPRASATALLKALYDGEDPEVMSRFPLAYTCTCSHDRVLRALAAMGREQLEEILRRDGQAEVTCEFCTARYVVAAPELEALLRAAGG